MAQPTLATLRASIRGAPSRSEQIEALDELIERSPQHPTKFLATVAVDDDVDVDLRLKAVAALGASTGKAAVDGLIAALESPSQPVVRRAAERLGGLPGTSQLEPLKKVRTANPATREAVEFAKNLVSYRNRLGDYKLPAKFSRIEPDPEAAEDVQVVPAPKTALSELMPRGSATIFGVNVTTKSAAGFTCGGRNFVIILSSDLVRGGTSWLAKGQAMPALALQQSLETGEYVPYFVVMTDPERGGRVRIRVAGVSGAVVLAGVGTVDGNTLAFDLAATKTEYLPPTNAHGTFDGDTGKFVIDKLLSERHLSPGQAKLTRTPRRQRKPTGGS